MNRIVMICVLITSMIIGANSSVIATSEVSNLICEYKTNPIGIDIERPRLSWKIVSDGQNISQTAYEIRLAVSSELLDNEKQILWTSNKVASSQSINIEYGGPALQSMQRIYWQVRIWDQNNEPTFWSEPAYWETGILKADQWKASWISISKEDKKLQSKPCAYFRKEFSTEKEIQSARVYVSALGLYELYLNGQKVGADLFTPGWTSYKKRIQYQTYDVTSALQQKNSIGAIVGDGWFRGNIGWGNQRNYYGDKNSLLVQLQLNYTDGTSEMVVTDNSWKVTTGAIRQSDIYNGETYDAQLEFDGWNKPEFDDKNWGNTVVLDYQKDILVAPQGVPVRAIQEIQPLKIFKTPKGEMVFDMGQNMVGWVRLKVKGKKGERVTLKFAEVLDKEGNFYTENLRSAKATDVYILKGDGVETWEPHFSFHGFRFVKIEGYRGTPDLDAITGVVIHSEMQPTGNFSCSDSLINQLQHNIQWGQKGNFLDVPTDCPQRDERLGWTGDAQVFSPTAAFNFNVAAFFTKWAVDISADQQPNGKVPYVVPDVLKGDGGSTAWADAAIIVPWNIYLAYGDKRILEVQYPSMKAWVEFMKKRAGDDLLWTGDFHFGDWLAFATKNSDYPGATTDKDLIATAYYCYSTRLLGTIAHIIGQKEDAEKYNQLSEKIKLAFINEFVSPAGRLISHTQTAYSLALAFDLLPSDLKTKAAKYLADDVLKFGHLTTGFVGTPLLCKTLSDNGYADLAFMLVNRKEYPSWLYPVTQGATTIWERWDGQKPDGTFQDVGMNSFNHYAYGAIGEWLYRYVAGLELDTQNPGYKHFLLQPHPGGGLKNAKIDYESIYGKIKSAWKLDEGNMVYEIQIPPNTSSTVILPNALLNDVLINGLPLSSSGIGKFVQSETNTIIELGSGSYVFNYPSGNFK